MTRRYLFAAFALSGICASARADLSYTQSSELVMENQKIPEKSTIYQKGSRFRYDALTDITIIDTQKKKITVLDKFKKTYTVMDWKPATDPSKPAPTVLTPTSQRAVIAGQPARLFTLKITFTKGSEMRGQLWCAENIARVAIPRRDDRAYIPERILEKVKGQLLRFQATITERGKARASLSWNVSSLSTRELPESYFDVPSGYSPAPEGAKEAR